MVVEVVLGKVGEDEVVEEQVPDAFLHRGMAGDFHDDGVGALLVHKGEERVEFEDVRRGAGSGFLAVFDLIGNGSYKADGQPGGGEEIADDVGRSCLAVGAGDAYQLAFGLPIETVGEKGKRVLVLGKLDDRQVLRDEFRDFRHEDGRSAALRRVVDVEVAVGDGAFLGYENEARLDLAAVKGNAGHFDFVASFDDLVRDIAQ